MMIDGTNIADCLSVESPIVRSKDRSVLLHHNVCAKMIVMWW